MMKWYSVESNVAKSIGIEVTKHEFSPPGERSDTDSFDNTNTEMITRNNGRMVLSSTNGEKRLLVDNIF